MKEDIESIGCIFLIALVVIAFTIGSIINHGKDVELEKYRIQMQVYGEPVNENVVERKD